MSAPPAARTTSAIELSSVTSTPAARPAMAASSPSRRSQAMTRAPSLASDRAMVWPMPRAAPATMAVRPSNRMSMDSALACLFAHDLLEKPVPTFPDHALAQSCAAGFLEAPDHQERDRRRRQEIEIGRRPGGAGGLDQPGRDERREAAKDRDRERVAARHPGRPQM